eukprot:2508151-Rhodomonas_salina.3
MPVELARVTVRRETDSDSVLVIVKVKAPQCSRPYTRIPTGDMSRRVQNFKLISLTLAIQSCTEGGCDTTDFVPLFCRRGRDLDDL